MRDAMARLRAALTPRVLFALGAALLIAWMLKSNGGTDGHTALERRAAQTLSAVAGAGAVRVVITTRAVREGTGQGIGLSSAQEVEIPVGAIAVAQGASDPLVRMELESALCALLGLPREAVNVMAGGT